MRAEEFLIESYEDELNSALYAILAKARKLGMSSVKTPQVVSQLTSQGYSITPDGLLNLLNDENVTIADKNIVNIQKMVSSATPQAITFNKTDTAATAVDDSGEKVKAMAMKAAKKEM